MARKTPAAAGTATAQPTGAPLPREGLPRGRGRPPGNSLRHRTARKTPARAGDDGGEQQIVQALLAAGTTVSYHLRHQIALAITSSSLSAEMNAQVGVMADCAEAKSGAIPNM